MASTKEFLNYVLEQLRGLENIAYYYMMKEYVIYYKGKVVGGIYNDRFLVKPTSSAKLFAQNAEMAQPYEGAKEMILVDNLDDREYLEKLIQLIYNELPEPKPKKKKQTK